MTFEIPPLGQRIKAARIKLGLTQTELATVIKVRQEAISKYERGISKSPRSNHMLKLAEALGETPEFLQFGTRCKRKKSAVVNNRINGEYRAVLLSMTEFQEAVEASVKDEELIRSLEVVVKCAKSKLDNP